MTRDWKAVLAEIINRSHKVNDFMLTDDPIMAQNTVKLIKRLCEELEQKI